jgi:hypothetical protein
MYVIEFHDDTIVYHGDFNFGSGDTIDDITLPSAVDSNFSMAIGPTIWGSKGAGTAYPEMFIWPRVYNTTTVRGERQSSGSTITGRYQVIQFAQAPGYYFAGYVTELGSPVTRTVRAYHRDTGELLGDATSSGVGGYYYLETTYSGSQYIITLDDTSGDTYNLLGYDLMVPTTISG